MIETARASDASPATPMRGLETTSFLGFTTFAVLALLVSRRVAVAVDGPADVAILVAAALAGFLAADLACGVVHWACDTFFEETTPVVGPTLIHSFREHHRDPVAISRRGFLDVNSHNCLAVLPVVVYVWSRDTRLEADATALFAQAAVVAFAVAAVLTNQFHKWAHAGSVSPLVRRLQRARLILPPAAHAQHHAGAHRTAYCVTFGWWNRSLDRVDFFGRLERGIRALGQRRAPIDCDRQSS